MLAESGLIWQRAAFKSRSVWISMVHQLISNSRLVNVKLGVNENSLDVGETCFNLPPQPRAESNRAVHISEILWVSISLLDAQRVWASRDLWAAKKWPAVEWPSLLYYRDAVWSVFWADPLINLFKITSTPTCAHARRSKTNQVALTSLSGQNYFLDYPHLNSF